MPIKTLVSGMITRNYQITVSRLLIAMTWFTAAAALAALLPGMATAAIFLLCHFVFFLVAGGVGCLFGRTGAGLASAFALVAFCWSVGCLVGIVAYMAE